MTWVKVKPYNRRQIWVLRLMNIKIYHTSTYNSVLKETNEHAMSAAMCKRWKPLVHVFEYRDQYDPSPLQSDLFQTASFNHSKLLTHSYKEKMSKQLMSFTCNGQQAIIMESMKTKPRNSLIWLLNWDVNVNQLAENSIVGQLLIVQRSNSSVPVVNNFLSKKYVRPNRHTSKSYCKMT